MKWNNIKTTILKEIRGVCRDKKTLQKLILYPLLIPMVILLFGFLFDGMTEADYVIGTNYKITEEEKLIIDELDGISLINYDNKSKLEKAYDNGEINGYIIKKDNTYTIYSDTSVNSGEIVLSAASSYLIIFLNFMCTSKLLLNNLGK